jgi:hypothetical protein
MSHSRSANDEQNVASRASHCTWFGQAGPDVGKHQGSPIAPIIQSGCWFAGDIQAHPTCGVKTDPEARDPPLPKGFSCSEQPCDDRSDPATRKLPHLSTIRDLCLRRGLSTQRPLIDRKLGGDRPVSHSSVAEVSTQPICRIASCQCNYSRALAAFHGRIRGPLQLLDPASTTEEPGRLLEDRFPDLRQEKSGRSQRANSIRARELPPAGPGLPPQVSILIAMRYKLRRGPIPRHLSSSRGFLPRPESLERCVSRPRDRPTSEDVLARFANRPTKRWSAGIPCEGETDFDPFGTKSPPSHRILGNTKPREGPSAACNPRCLLSDHQA